MLHGKVEKAVPLQHLLDKLLELKGTGYAQLQGKMAKREYDSTLQELEGNS